MEHQIPSEISRQLTAFGKELLQSILDDRFDYKFTDFEKEVLLLILLKQSKYEIANALEVSIGVVEENARSIFSKLDGGSQATGGRVPRRPYPGGNNFSAEEVPERTVLVGDLDIPTSIGTHITDKRSISSQH